MADIKELLSSETIMPAERQRRPFTSEALANEPFADSNGVKSGPPQTIIYNGMLDNSGAPIGVTMPNRSNVAPPNEWQTPRGFARLVR